MTGWQPIETAPRDGTEVLLFWKGGGCGVYHFNHYGNWDDGDYSSHMTDDDFSHWMPIPEPPETND